MDRHCPQPDSDKVRGVVVYESLICIEYFCDCCVVESSAADRLRPSSAVGKARMRLLCHHFGTVVAPAQYTFFMNHQRDEASSRALQTRLEESLDVFEKQLQSSGGPFLMGEKISLVDVHVAPFFLRMMVVSLEHYQNYVLSADRFPLLLDWFETCQTRPSAQATALSKQAIIDVYGMFRRVDYKFGGLNRN